MTRESRNIGYNMGRNRKEGLDYFPFEVDFFNDIKVRKLIKYQGGKAVTVYALLLCFIYKSGYYLRWDKELPFIISEQTGFDEAYISEVIKNCLLLGLLDQELYNQYEILTSRGIQDRYIYICTTLKRKVVIDSIYNISSSENTISSEEINISSEENDFSSEEMPINSLESTQKKRKEKEIKEKDKKENANSGNKSNGKQYDLSFVASEFVELFTEWLEYKRARRETYTTAVGLKKCYSHLLNLSGNDVEKAKLIVEQSIANNYAGLFELKADFAKQAQQRVRANLGVDEFINQQGKRTYGTGKYLIPDNAPPRPSDKHYWNQSTQQWLI